MRKYFATRGSNEDTISKFSLKMDSGGYIGILYYDSRKECRYPGCLSRKDKQFGQCGVDWSNDG